MLQTRHKHGRRSYLSDGIGGASQSLLEPEPLRSKDRGLFSYNIDNIITPMFAVYRTTGGIAPVVHAHIRTRTHAHEQTHTHAHTRTNARTHTHIHAHTHTHAHTHARAHTHTHTHARAHTHAHTHTHTIKPPTAGVQLFGHTRAVLRLVWPFDGIVQNEI